MRCRRCGRRLTVWYTGRAHNVSSMPSSRRAGQRRAALHFLRRDDRRRRHGQRSITCRPTAAIDAAVVASEDAARQQDEVLQAWTRDLEAARYAAQRAQRQYDATDPANRLVADELERRWNQALQRVHDIEARIEQHRHGHPAVAIPTREEFAGLASDLDAVWHGPRADVRLKKRLVRTLIHELIVDVDADAGEVILVIHWSGGAYGTAGAAATSRAE